LVFRGANLGPGAAAFRPRSAHLIDPWTLRRPQHDAEKMPPLSKAGGGGTELGVLGSRRVPQRCHAAATPLTHTQVSAGVAAEIAELALILNAAAIPPWARWITIPRKARSTTSIPC